MARISHPVSVAPPGRRDSACSALQTQRQRDEVMRGLMGRPAGACSPPGTIACSTCSNSTISFSSIGCAVSFSRVSKGGAAAILAFRDLLALGHMRLLVTFRAPEIAGFARSFTCLCCHGRLSIPFLQLAGALCRSPNSTAVAVIRGRGERALGIAAQLDRAVDVRNHHRGDRYKRDNHAGEMRRVARIAPN